MCSYDVLRVTAPYGWRLPHGGSLVPVWGRCTLPIVLLLLTRDKRLQGETVDRGALRRNKGEQGTNGHQAVAGTRRVLDSAGS